MSGTSSAAKGKK